jgi:trigger factor
VKSSITTLEENKVKVSVEVDEAEVDKAIDEAFRKIAKEVRLPGFRPGKAPRRVLEARLGTDYARGEALNDAIPEYYRKAIIEHDVDVISSPDLDLTSGQEGGPVAFEAVVEVRPVIVVAGYDGIRIEIAAPSATDEEITAQIDALRSQAAEREETDRPAIDGDYVTMDIVGKEGEDESEGLTTDDYTYEVGAGFVVEAIDDELRGAKVGDIREFEGPHPNDEDVVLSFRILVKKIEEKVLPELTDEFVAEVSEFETVEALTENTRDRIEAMKRAAAQTALHEKTAEGLAELVTDDIPTALIDDQVQRQLQDLAMRLASQGVEFEQFLEMTGQDVTEITESLREPAEQAAKVDLALRSVAVAEGVSLTDEDMQAELDQMGPQFGEDGPKLRLALEESGQLSSMRADMAKQRAMEFVIEKVTIVDFDGNEIDPADIADPEPEADASDATGSDSPESPVEAADVSDTGADSEDDTTAESAEGDEQ